MSAPLLRFLPGEIAPQFADHPEIRKLDKHSAGGIVTICRPGERVATRLRGLRVTAPAPYVGEPACYSWVVFVTDGGEPVYAVGPMRRLSALTAYPDRGLPGRPRCRDGVPCRAGEHGDAACPRDVLYGTTPLCARYPLRIIEAAFDDAQQQLRRAHASGAEPDVLDPLYERERQLAQAVKAWRGWAAAPLLQLGRAPRAEGADELDSARP